jgi:hypothetical protein
MGFKQYWVWLFMKIIKILINLINKNKVRKENAIYSE